MDNYILEMKDIKKYIFDVWGRPLPGTDVLILDDVYFNLRYGEVNVLLGENGAGKSTLMKILAGEIPHDAGSFVLEGKPVHFTNPRESRQMGVSFIHQELNLCANLDVAHNIFLGRENVKGHFFLDKDAMYKKSQAIIDSIGIKINPKARVEHLSTAQQQVVEIAKAVSFNVKVLIMDEPTASLTSQEIETLFKLIADMRARGMSIVFISHRMEEIGRVADRITVMRDGQTVGIMEKAEFTVDKAVRMMVGRSVSQIYPEKRGQPGENVLEVDQIKIGAKTQPINIKLRAGEIVGIGGLVGMGRTELAKCIFGAHDQKGGEVLVNGKKYSHRSPRKSIQQGITYLSEDRKTEGLILDLNIRENISSATMFKTMNGPFLSKTREQKLAEKMIQKFNIICRTSAQRVGTLSGGNQQKVCFAKWYACEPLVFILDEPTRGVDVGAKAQIHELMNEAARSGLAILMITSEMNELIGMSDRIYIMRDGGIVAEINDPKNMTSEKVLEYTIGIK